MTMALANVSAVMLSEAIFLSYVNVSIEIEHRFAHSSDEAIRRRCIYVHEIPVEERCAWVKKTKRCDAESQFIKYHEWLFCSVKNPVHGDPVFALAALLLFLGLLLIFLFLATTADEFFCPCLGMISKLLHLSESLAGVTLVAFGNGAPDVIASFSGSSGNTILMYNQLLGGAMFETALIAGWIAVMRPFNLQVYPTIRDMAFLIGSIVWVRQSTQDEEITMGEAISFIAIYAVYIAVVICVYVFQSRLKKFSVVDFSDAEILGYGSSAAPADDSEPTEETCKTFLAETLRYLNPVDAREWRESSASGKICVLAKAIPLTTLRLFIPVMNMSLNNDGWCKMPRVLNVLLLPTVVVVLLGKQGERFDGPASVPVPAVTAVSGVALAVAVHLTSRRTTPPRYHRLFLPVALAASTLTIYILVGEVVALLAVFGTLLKMNVATLGLTVLAWGNNIGDAIANITIARQGLQRMAFSACFGGPMFTVLLGMGVTFTVRNLKDHHSITVRSGTMGPVCSTFLLINLAFSFVYVMLTNFQARKSYGWFLLLLYVEFIVFCVLCETDVIHPLGADHEGEAVADAHAGMLAEEHLP